MKYTFCCILFMTIMVMGCASSTSPTGSPQGSVTPTQSLTEALPYAADHLEGTGDTRQSFIVTESGTRVFSMDYQGEQPFTVELRDSQGTILEILADEPGRYNGIMASDPLQTGTYYLDVTASGPWTIDISSQ